MRKVFFLKLGGSVITDKDSPNTPRIDRIDAIAQEIVLALHEDPGISLVLGHGSGSFGHHAAKKYGTVKGVKTKDEWKGFVEVAFRARELNQIVMERLQMAGIPALSISPLSCVQSENHQIAGWDCSQINQCINNEVIPVIYGDVVFDSHLGGTILSTEELFSWLAMHVSPQQILLAGLEDGVWKEFPNKTEMIHEINPKNVGDHKSDILDSISPDVTGGMRSKVNLMVSLIQQLPSLEVQIFSGVQKGNIRSTLLGERVGTLIRNPRG